MNVVDIIIVVMAVSAIFRGHELGLARQLGSTLGFGSGMLLGVYLQPYTTTMSDNSINKAVIALSTILILAFTFLVIGEYIGIKLKSRFTHRGVHAVDSWFGAVIGTVTLLLAVWLGAAILSIMPFTGPQEKLRESVIISKLNQNLPSTTSVITGLSNLLEPNGFPRVFIGSEPTMPGNTTIPGIGADLQQVIDRSKNSVVKFEGIGCGGIVEGSGFVIASDLIITNAHVIAGVNQPYVRDSHGQHTATAVWFDPDLDFAIVRANNLAGTPLLLNNDFVKNGSRGVILGYPGGGNLTAGGAEVIDHFTARGYDIYGSSTSVREVYSLAGKVIPGNSGGPLIGEDGRVMGVIFAQSTTHSNVGYALSIPQLTAAINQAQAQNRPVSTGKCAQS